MGIPLADGSSNKAVHRAPMDQTRRMTRNCFRGGGETQVSLGDRVGGHSKGEEGRVKILYISCADVPTGEEETQVGELGRCKRTRTYLLGARILETPPWKLRNPATLEIVPRSQSWSFQPST